MESAMRVDTTNNNTDWTKTKQGLAPLVHDIWLTNERHATLHTTLPVMQSCTDMVPRTDTTMARRAVSRAMK
jgi:hypothetical protein